MVVVCDKLNVQNILCFIMKSDGSSMYLTKTQLLILSLVLLRVFAEGLSTKELGVFKIDDGTATAGRGGVSNGLPGCGFEEHGEHDVGSVLASKEGGETVPLDDASGMDGEGGLHGGGFPGGTLKTGGGLVVKSRFGVGMDIVSVLSFPVIGMEMPKAGLIRDKLMDSLTPFISTQA